ncbi:hypothetical protein QYE76_041316 [Lolium multiflorum]|uniref:Reverse transcriptase Ty1/copia-type domain-containing protein n=1 Tax=Lolium multiflorum TaxID=4521 RepID=A0AAD8TF23_LOLMU|nr:hypothetical protein QYE76_041316 [Lolium multiflorum]
MARTMLSEFNSPHNFWGEAISTAVHYSNRLFLRPSTTKLHMSFSQNSHAYRYYNRSTGTIEVSCDMVFLEDNGSQVEQVVPCVAGNDDDPSSAIKHMGIGHIRPMEVHSDDQVLIHSRYMKPWLIRIGSLPCKKNWSVSLNEVWSLVERPKDHRINVIGTKWVFKNKQDEDGIVIRNKARLVAQGFAQIEGGSSDDDRGGLAKRGRTVPRPPGCRTSNRKSTKAPQSTDIGSSARGGHKSTGNKRKDKQAAQEDDEIVPDFNVADANRLDWQDLRTVNPYRYEQRTYTGGDKFFWTKTQAALWVGYYDNTHECMKNGVVVKPKAINPEELALHEATKYRFVVQTLKGMGLYDLVCLKPDDDQEDPTYCPLLVRQFHCTVFFHDDADRTMTWMTGREKYSCTYTQFCEAMGYDGGRSTGYRIHTRPKLASGDISFCYPTGPTAGPPTISGMYYSYLVLAKMFRESLISKSGDSSEVRNYHLNLMYYCHPARIRKIDGCDLIYCELKRAVMDRMTPNYTQYVQRLINHIVPAPLNTRDERVIMAPFKFPAPEGRPEVPSMMPANERRSKEHHDPAASSSYSRRPKHGAARFFSSMWQMCKNTNDVAHQSLALNQETRRRQNEFMATRNVPVPPPGPVGACGCTSVGDASLTDEMIQTLTSPCMLMVAFLLGLLVLLLLLLMMVMVMVMRMKVMRLPVMMTRAPTPPGMSSIDGCDSISPLSFAFLVFRCQRGRRE